MKSIKLFLMFLQFLSLLSDASLPSNSGLCFFLSFSNNRDSHLKSETASVKSTDLIDLMGLGPQLALGKQIVKGTVTDIFHILAHSHFRTRQAYLGDIVGLVPDHCNKANITIK